MQKPQTLGFRVNGFSRVKITSKSTNLIPMRKLTATLCLTFAVLLGSEVRGSYLPTCKGSPTSSSERVMRWSNCEGLFIPDAAFGRGPYSLFRVINREMSNIGLATRDDREKALQNDKKFSEPLKKQKQSRLKQVA